MGSEKFIVGDWGTTHLRLFLCDSEGAAIDSVSGPGAADSGGRFESVFNSLTADWRRAHGGLTAVLCGMVGSTFGWMQAPYVPCPARPEQIARACISLVGGSVFIIPGLSCRNLFNAPDFLRGEETQVLGALDLDPRLRNGSWLICLPGTHTKWVAIEDGQVREFLTAPTGEVFAALREHSVLVRGRTSGRVPLDMTAFRQGVAQFHEFQQSTLLHRLFEVRGRQLGGEFGPDAATAYMSGLLIASDVQGALSALSDSARGRGIFLVGAPELMQLYAHTCAQRGHGAILLDGEAAALRGLVQMHRQLTR